MGSNEVVDCSGALEEGAAPQEVIHYAKALEQCGGEESFLFSCLQEMIEGISTVRVYSISPHDVDTEKSLHQIAQAMQVCQPRKN